MRARHWLLGVAMVVATAGCGMRDAERVNVLPPPAIEAAPARTVDVGETVRFSMHTHCGVESTRINGQVWNAVEPLYSSSERLGPPAGWGDPEQVGDLTLETESRAVFVAVGQRVVLAPAASGQPLRPCD